jgi:ribonuclease HII
MKLKNDRGGNLFEIPGTPRRKAGAENIDTFYLSSGYKLIAGVDEAGRGAIAGPVCAAAVILGENKIDGLNDSKKLSADVREKLYGEILKGAKAVGISMHSAAWIDESDILKCTLESMKIAVVTLGLKPDIVLVDGSIQPKWGWDSVALVKGDSRSRSIMAASIVAKVSRDRWMVAAAKYYPGWDFEKHKGYCVMSHVNKVRERGVSPIHRMTFSPCSEL